MQRALPTLNDLTHEAASFVAELHPKERATLVTLSGELGAGKTSFVQGAATALGVLDPVTSPTFVLEKIYLLPGGPFKRLVHVDAYRLTKGAELAALGFEEVLRNPENLVMLEWPEHVADLLPPTDVAITLAVEGEGRTIFYA